MVSVQATGNILKKCTSAAVLVVAFSLLAGCASTKVVPPVAMASAEPLSKSAALAEAQTLNAAYKKNPEDVATAIQFSRSLQTMGSQKEAISVLATTAERRPDDPVIVAAYGKSLLSAGRAEEAAMVLKRAQQLDKNDWRVVSALGLAHDQMKRYVDARKYYVTAA
ncbi:MAG: tetratricopeptide repeat protein, partial [Halocynthiibacter sp.]